MGGAISEGGAAPPATHRGPIVGILGDIHGDVARAALAIRQLKQRGATDLILTGDLVGFDDEASPYFEDYADFNRLRRLRLDFSDIQKKLQAAAERQMTEILETVRAAGFARENVYLMPGNWEKEWAPSFPKVFPRYGQVVSENYIGKGVIALGERKIMVSHYPKIPVPKQYLGPSNGTANGIPNDPLMEAGMSSLGYPDSRVDLIVFAHTHQRAAYRDARVRTWVLNPGSITAGHQAAAPPSYAIYDTDKNRIEIRGLKQNLIEAHLLNIDPVSRDQAISCLKKVVPTFW